MLMQRWIGPVLICLALGGCCTDGTLCMKAPTSGPEMAWDGAGGQPPDRDIPRAKRPRRAKNEIVSAPLQAIEPDSTRTNVANSPAAEQPDQAAIAEAQLKDRLVICRGCLSKPPPAQADAVSPDHQMTAVANQ
jgi:hypothetical protein